MGNCFTAQRSKLAAAENWTSLRKRVIRARNFAQFNFVNKLLRRISVENKIFKMASGLVELVLSFKWSY